MRQAVSWAAAFPRPSCSCLRASASAFSWCSRWFSVFCRTSSFCFCREILACSCSPCSRVSRISFKSPLSFWVLASRGSVSSSCFNRASRSLILSVRVFCVSKVSRICLWISCCCSCSCRKPPAWPDSSSCFDQVSSSFSRRRFWTSSAGARAVRRSRSAVRVSSRLAFPAPNSALRFV